MYATPKSVIQYSHAVKLMSVSLQAKRRTRSDACSLLSSLSRVHVDSVDYEGLVGNTRQKAVLFGCSVVVVRAFEVMSFAY